MRNPSWIAVLIVAGLGSAAQAQCYYYYPPRAPDMLNPGYYYYNCQGYLYGPYHCVRPPFEPFQGMLPGPRPSGQGQGQGGFDASTPMMGGGAAVRNAGMGMPGLWTHPNVRSPRDFFMIETDPARSDYQFGVGRGAGLPSQAGFGAGREAALPGGTDR